MWSVAITARGPMEALEAARLRASPSSPVREITDPREERSEEAAAAGSYVSDAVGCAETNDGPRDRAVEEVRGSERAADPVRARAISSVELASSVAPVSRRDGPVNWGSEDDSSPAKSPGSSSDPFNVTNLNCFAGCCDQALAPTNFFEDES